jgi:hypothetical protein
MFVVSRSNFGGCLVKLRCKNFENYSVRRYLDNSNAVVYCRTSFLLALKAQALWATRTRKSKLAA